ncbi:MAG: hypothetical protein ABSG42_06135, partial [Nitrospirota bacterium]
KVNQMTKDTYEKRIIAYADIIGWSEACRNPLNFDLCRNIVNQIANHSRSFSPDIKQRLKDTSRVPNALIEEHACIEFSFFSDNFAVSAPVNRGQKVFEIMTWASNQLLLKRFSVRGGVTIGDLYHDHRVIFGPAMVEAVELERKAYYPRLLCSEELSQHLKQTDYREKVVLADYDKGVIANIACGSLHARDDLIKIIQGKLYETKELSHKLKWQYLLETLPKMYEALSILY